MIVDRLNLTDFRNYASADVGFAEGANLIVGSNGQGKTNLVESLGYLSTLGSHRVSTDHAMIRQGSDAAIVRAQLRHDERHLLVEVQLNRSSANRAQVNRSPIKVRELPRYFSSVLFAPEDLALVRGEPAGRRRFLDELLVLRSPRLTGVFADYERVLRQRNSLLKSARSSGVKTRQLTTLDIWDERLVALGSEIIVARADLVAALLPEVRCGVRFRRRRRSPRRVDQLPQHLWRFRTRRRRGRKGSGGAPSATDSLTAADVEAAFRSQLAALRRTELDRGVTLVGPHRDDLVLGLNRMPARGYASHGESWSFALSLKLASAVLLRRESSLGDPVLILDDVFAELDEHRRARLAEAVEGFAQVLITAAVFDEIPRELTGNTVHIAAGAIVPGAGTTWTAPNDRGEPERPRRPRTRTRVRIEAGLSAISARFRRRVVQVQRRAQASQKGPGASVPFSAGRDPQSLSSVVDALTVKLGWNSPLAKSELLASWSELAGVETAEHSTPVGIEEGTLSVRCDSTAWATQLRLMRGAILGQITTRYPDAGITQVRFLGPNVPSWKRGPRSIPGRGPRDTYG